MNYEWSTFLAFIKAVDKARSREFAELMSAVMLGARGDSETIEGILKRCED
jgi:hypothetical protein